jgi:hypothetical protein
MKIIDKCPEGGEGEVISSIIFTTISRCTCVECPAASKCKRLIAYLLEKDAPLQDTLYVPFCGNLTSTPEEDCNYFISNEK